MLTNLLLLSTYYIIAGVQIFAQQLIITRFGTQRIPLLRLALSATALLLINEGMLHLLSLPDFVFISLWLLLLIASYALILEQPFKKSILMALFQMTLAVMLQHITIICMSMIGGAIQEYAQTSQLLLRVMNTGIMFLVYWLFLKTRFFSYFFDSPSRTRFLWIVYMLFLLLFTLPMMMEIERNQRPLTETSEIYSIVLLGSFFIYNIIYIRNAGKAAHIAQQLQVQQLYSETLERANGALIGFKHDFSNILHTISGLLEFGDYSALHSYMEKLNTEFYMSCTSGVLNPQLKKHPLLYGVVLSKASLAELKGIEFIVYIETQVSTKYCEALDLSRMVGILLDNALEAAADSAQPRVTLRITEHRERQIYEITNTCSMQADLSSIFKKGYTTKENHSGTGLSTILAIVKKYRTRDFAMDIKTLCEDGLFSQVLTI